MLHGSFSESNNMNDPPSDRIRRLTSTTPDGKPYVRSAAVQAEIEALFDLPASAVSAKRRKLRKETLVFFIREFRHKDDYASGQLLERLQKRTADTIRGRVKHLDHVDQEDIVMQVEMEIMELILCETPSRASDFLEVAFGQAVKRQTKDALAKLMNGVAGHIANFDVHPENNDYPDEETERPIEFLPDSRPSQETMLIESEGPDIARDKLLKAWDAVDDPLCLHAWIAHHCDGIPIQSNDPEREDLVTRFNATPRQVKYWLEKGRKTMRAAVEQEE